ncbi:MAG: PIN domain-containing protein [Solirubrobacterales bacterium]|nr:PIN domain-containing protein [Solirubrobacterales bacterium]
MSGCTFDTDVVIAILDRADAHHTKATEGLREMIEGSVDLAICTINYAEALVRPALDRSTFEVAVDAIAALGIEPVAPTAAIARDAAHRRGLGISLADGFALATAEARGDSLASFDLRVIRAARKAGVELALQ